MKLSAPSLLSQLDSVYIIRHKSIIVVYSIRYVLR